MHIKFEKVIISCPLCAGTKFHHFGGREHFGYRISYQICDYWSMIFMNPQMNAETMDDFYKKEYRKLYQNNETPTEYEVSFQFVRGQNQALSVASIINERKIQIQKYLDIGCSAGSHLLSIGKLFPSAALFGVEPGDAYRDYCSSRGILAFSNLDELVVRNLKFNAISISHVLEHISDPVSYLKYLNQELLFEEGIIMIEVPNTLGGHGAFEIAHPICFTKRTLMETMGLAGFDIIQITTHHVTQPNRELDLYLLAIGRRTSFDKMKIRKKNYLMTKFLRRRGFKNESLGTSLKIIAKELMS